MKELLLGYIKSTDSVVAKDNDDGCNKYCNQCA